MSVIDTTSIQQLCQALAQSVGLAQHLLVNSQLTATTMVVDHNDLKQQCDHEWTAQQIAQNLLTQHEGEIQQLQTRNQKTPVESNAYQDRITTLEDELNYGCANAEAVHTAAAAVSAAPGKQPFVQPASIPDPRGFNGSRDKFPSFVSHLCMKLAGNASRFPNLEHQLR
jgi:hypothetical protein